MKTLITIVLGLLLFQNSITYGQKNAVAGAAIIGGAIAATAIVKAEIEQMKEILEQTATEYILTTDTLSEFQLKLINFEATKLSDLSTISALVFIVKPRSAPPYILLYACSKGWVNDFGLNFSLVKPVKFNKENWTALLIKYLQISGYHTNLDINNIPLYEKRFLQTYMSQYSIADLNEKKIIPINNVDSYFQLTKHVGTLKSLIDIDGDDFDFEIYDDSKKKQITLSYPLKRLDGDSYTVADFNEDLKVVFNENDMNIFFKETEDLSKIKRKVVLKITKELF